MFQRPQHLLTRFARQQRVFYVEEPVVGQGPARLDTTLDPSGIWQVVPVLPDGLLQEEIPPIMAGLVDRLIEQFKITRYVVWYYTPMAREFTHHLEPSCMVYDCMDELSAFKGASQKMKTMEAELFQRADLVFTGGQSLYEAKRGLHPHVYPFPSSIDKSHFGRARHDQPEPADQASIPHPRLGFFGVIDERMDIPLLAHLAEQKPDCQIVMLGPTVKIDPATLPRNANIHYLGMKSYNDLPAYLAGWDVALLPFAQNESTRFISPTKTPEYLAGGKPVVSSPIADVVRPYGENDLVYIAATPAQFVQAVDAALNMSERQTQAWLQRVDECLDQNSWDLTWQEMVNLIEAALPTSRAQ